MTDTRLTASFPDNIKRLSSRSAEG